jgi:hypothetical protein
MVQGKVLIGGNWPIDMMTRPFFRIDASGLVIDTCISTKMIYKRLL